MVVELTKALQVTVPQKRRTASDVEQFCRKMRKCAGYVTQIWSRHPKRSIGLQWQIMLAILVTPRSNMARIGCLLPFFVYGVTFLVLIYAFGQR